MLPGGEGAAGETAAQFGSILRGLREAAGLTQEELAERSGLTARSVGGIERGRPARPHLRSVRMLADALELAGHVRAEFQAAARRERLNEVSVRSNAQPPEPPPAGAQCRAGKAIPSAGSGPASEERSAPEWAHAAEARQAREPGRVRRHPLTIPRQLPSGVAPFPGRERELAELDRILAQDGWLPGVTRIAAISGMPGVGKSALAVHWAHQAAGNFPDGQLHADLRGFNESRRPAEPGEVIRGFLDAFGVPVEQIPAALDQQAALYRSMLAGRRVIIVLDGARDAEQLRPLLPASPGCVVLVTSRRQLSSLAAAEGARLLILDVLSPPAARELLTGRLGGERGRTESDAISELAESCGRLPLALSVAAARAAGRPRFPLAVLAAELRDRQGRLSVLDTGDPAASIRAVFSWSYDKLSTAAARLFRLLGLHPGPDVTIAAAASMAGLPREDASRLLAELTDLHLIAEHVPGRFVLHDLLRAYAIDRAQAEAAIDGPAALCRLLDHYLHTAHSADRQLNPARDAPALDRASPGVVPENIAGDQQALDWMLAEHKVLLAAVQCAADARLDRHALQLAATLVTFLDRQGRLHDYAATQKIAVDAARRVNLPAAQAQANLDLGGAYGRLGQFDSAKRSMSEALAEYSKLQDRSGQGRAHLSLSWLCNQDGRYGQSLAHCQDALNHFTASNDELWQARAMGQIGWCRTLMGDHIQAISVCHQALSLHQRLGDRLGEAAVSESIGDAQRELGDYARAVAHFKRSARLYAQLGEQFYEAEAMTRLGDTQQAAGNLPAARAAWRAAMVILAAHGHPGADELRVKLGNPGQHGKQALAQA